MIPYAALYERLSKEDDTDGESASIAHQKEVLETYATHHGYPRFRHFTDDGYSGRNFDRPGFQEMLEEIRQGHIEAVIVRDLSRLGRNYLETGHYMEEVFPQHHVRFIALMNDVDMTRKTDTVMAPFYNLMNDWYSRDLSRRATVSRRLRQKNGLRDATKPMYGYRADSNDPRQWVIDPVAAGTIRMIYRMALEGMSAPEISKALEEAHILRIGVYARSIGQKFKDTSLPYKSDYEWNRSVISVILRSPEYMGTKVLHKEVCTNGKSHRLPLGQQYLFPEDHEAIIPPFLWEAVRDRRSRHISKKPLHPFLTLPDIPYLFSCSCCGKTLNATQEKHRCILLCRALEVHPHYRVTDTKTMEAVIRLILRHLWCSIQDPDALLNSLTQERQKNKARQTVSRQTRREDLEARRCTILHYQVRLDREQEQGTLDDSLIRTLHRSYNLELQKLKQEEDSLSLTETAESPPVTHAKVRDALLPAIFAFVQDVSVGLMNKETSSQSVTIRLRVRIPHPGRSRLQINKKVLNIRWEIPEEAPTTEEVLLLLASTEMIL